MIGETCKTCGRQIGCSQCHHQPGSAGCVAAIAFIMAWTGLLWHIANYQAGTTVPIWKSHAAWKAEQAAPPPKDK